MSRSPMIVRTVPALRRALDGLRAKKATIALVPTMGALHDGHVSLVRLAKRRAKKVIVSIFVNPTQFAPSEDFSSYPRTWKADVARLAAENVDLIWNPDVKTMYPDGFATKILHRRPGHCGSGRSLPAAFLRRRHHRGRQAVHAMPAGFRDLRRKGFPAIAGGDADGQGSRSRRQGDRLENRARTRRAGDVFAQRLFVAGRAPHGARALPRHEGERKTLAGRRRHRGRDGRRRRADHERRIRPRLFRDPPRRDAGADRLGKGRPGANSGGGQAWKDAADRQYRARIPDDTFPSEP